MTKKEPSPPPALWRTAGRPARPPHRIHVQLGRPVPTFDFIGGHPVLDFNDTAAWAVRGALYNRVSEPGAFVRWAAEAGLISTKDGLKLRRFVFRHFDRARRELTEAHRFRGVIHDILIAITRNVVPPEDALAEVQHHARRAGKFMRPEWSDGQLRWVGPPPTNLLAITARIAWRAGEFFGSADVDRLRCCANPKCGWFFIDHSRNNSRRWCMMRECGDRTKSKRYYEKNKKLCK